MASRPVAFSGRAPQAAGRAPRTPTAAPAWHQRAPGARAPTAGRMAAAAPGFDTEGFDKERLKLDEQARNSMIRKAELDMSAPPGSKEGAWKWEMRKRMWDYMEGNDIARPPRPVHHRIPNFVGAKECAERLAELQEFKSAKLVKVNPDTPSKPVRALVLAGGKQLLAPQPRLRTGFFSILDASSFPRDALNEATTSAGAAKYGRPLGLEETRSLKVDLLVVGSSCVSANGARLGKGEGFAEVEYGILALLGAVDETTPVVTVVHDCQVLEGDEVVPADKMLEHDVPVDIIVTPTRVIRCSHPPGMKRPPGILWHKLSPEKLASIRVLQQLKERIEAETGTKLPSGPSETLPPLAKRGRDGGRGGGGGGGRGRGGGGGGRGGRGGGGGRGRGRGGGEGGGRGGGAPKAATA